MPPFATLLVDALYGDISICLGVENVSLVTGSFQIDWRWFAESVVGLHWTRDVSRTEKNPYWLLNLGDLSLPTHEAYVPTVH